MSKSLLDLKGIGEKALIKLSKIGINSIEELLFHLPNYLQALIVILILILIVV